MCVNRNVIAFARRDFLSLCTDVIYNEMFFSRIKNNASNSFRAFQPSNIFREIIIPL